VVERGVELRQAANLDHQVELAETGRCEAELAAGQTIPLDQALLLQMSQIGADRLGEGQIADAGLQIAPDVVNVHRLLATMIR
jgi:hypothetical protein